MGGHEAAPEHGTVQRVVVRDEFDVVLSLLSLPGHGPAPGVEHHVHAIPDGPLDEGELAGVGRLARIAGAAVADGRRVLVHCYSGYNRSGLVIAAALIADGHTADEAIRLIRARRSPYALHNDVFVGYLRAGELG
ncbi:dual specificity protein phosphatase family protein [Streptomyces monticola]|uniref:Dual specificity protein phosphatase family protein n=1 Tax=Streptomyces monticola TaxID=2666263 RepID=A0ABW2JH13_9ACTN